MLRSKILKNIFTEKFIKRIDIGNEYFEGDENEMIKIFVHQIDIQINNIKKDLDNVLYEDIK